MKRVDNKKSKENTSKVFTNYNFYANIKKLLNNIKKGIAKMTTQKIQRSTRPSSPIRSRQRRARKTTKRCNR